MQTTQTFYQAYAKKQHDIMQSTEKGKRTQLLELVHKLQEKTPLKYGNFLRAEELFFERRYEDALRTYAKVSSPFALFYRLRCTAYLLRTQRDYKRAIQVSRAALKLCPQDVLVQKNLLALMQSHKTHTKQC